MISKRLNLILMSAMLVLTLSVIGTAEARNCKKGKPCGNSCIAVNDVCHKSTVGTSADTPASDPIRQVAPASATDRAQSLSAPTQGAEKKEMKSAKHCTTGKSCGNACIPKDAVCHR